MKQHYYLSLDSQGFHRLAYTSWGTPTDRPLICVHGVARNSRDFDVLAHYLSKQGYWVICPDIAGRGLSDWLSNSEDYNTELYLHDLMALIARLNVEQVDWLGTSLGGLLGMALASKPNSPIRRLILNDIGPDINNDGLKRLQAYVNAGIVNFNSIEHAIRYFKTALNTFGSLPEDIWRHIAKNGIKPNKTGGYTLRKDPAIMLNKIKSTDQQLYWQLWEKVRCPSLILHGELSDVLLAETTAKMKHHHRRCEIVTIPEVGHAPSLMTEEQVSLINHWLKHTRSL